MVNGPAFPSRDALTIGFAHVAYRAAEEFAARRTGVAHFEVRTLEELERLADEADVLVVSGLWRDTLLTRAPKLRFVQSFSAGTDQYDKRCSSSMAFGWPMLKAPTNARWRSTLSRLFSPSRVSFIRLVTTSGRGGGAA